MSTGCAPGSTYRVQLSSGFTLDDLAAQVPYLAELGVTDIYLSPLYAARPGSPHGYDIVDYECVNPELGGRQAWQRLCQTLRAHGLGVVLDVVPNHMAADPVHNRMWRQMLRGGQSSPAALYLDVDWRPLTGLIRGKVLLPVLEEPYGEALLQERIAIERAEGEVRVRYGSIHLPLADGSLALALEAIDHSAGSRSAGASGPVSDAVIRETNADPRRLHAVLEAQHYRLAYWRAANDEINYRRFFDVNWLVAIRPEEDEVFEESHRLVLRLAAEDVVRGLRVDHVDGLLDPRAYLRRLRAAADEASGRRAWIVVEKILGRAEVLDPEWPVDGTTGYDALNVLNRLFISGRGLRTLRHFHQKLVGSYKSFGDVAHRSKRLAMQRPLRSGLTMVAHAVKRAADASWTTRDATLNALTTALVEFIACLPVYRTYLGTGGSRRADREAVEEAVASAIRRNPLMDESALNFVRSLLLEPAAEADPELAQMRRGVLRRLEQYTSGVHAKGVEDTAFYRDNMLLALNEVGGDPGGPSGTLDEFHRFSEQRARRWPGSHNATSTHDTKLGEDARIRIASLSEYASEWTVASRAWMAANAAFRRSPSKGPQLDVGDEYRFYQALVGIWPAGDCAGGGPADPQIVERVSAYMRKAVREAEVHTSWIRVNEEYEAALDRFVRGVLTEEAAAGFRQSLRQLVCLVLPVSLCHSLSQVVLKLLMPGVPDVYQGAESWALWLTDPDNRQPVDFSQRMATLRSLCRDVPTALSVKAGSPGDVLSMDLKPYVTARLLRFRRMHRTAMAKAGYVPIRARGARASATVAFRRTFGGEHVVVAVPRLVERSAVAAGWPAGAAFWGDTTLGLPSQVGAWTHVLTGRTVSLARPSRAALADLTVDWPWLVLHGRE